MYVCVYVTPPLNVSLITNLSIVLFEAPAACDCHHSVQTECAAPVAAAAPPHAVTLEGEKTATTSFVSAAVTTHTPTRTHTTEHHMSAAVCSRGQCSSCSANTAPTSGSSVPAAAAVILGDGVGWASHTDYSE